MLSIIKNVAQVVDNCPDGDRNSCLTTLPDVAANSTTLTNILSIVFGTITAITVIIIIIQGLKFILSDGNPEKAASARKGIIYAVVGLALSLSANLIVVFVLRDVL